MDRSGHNRTEGRAEADGQNLRQWLCTALLAAPIPLAGLPGGRDPSAQGSLPDKFQFEIGARGVQFDYPAQPTVAPNSPLYVPDQSNHHVQVFGADGTI